jgi:hypothetical protein
MNTNAELEADIFDADTRDWLQCKSIGGRQLCEDVFYIVYNISTYQCV